MVGDWIGLKEECRGSTPKERSRAELLDNLRDALDEALEMNRHARRSAAVAAGEFEEVGLFPVTDWPLPVIFLAARWRKGFFMPNPGTRRQWVLAVLDRYEAPLVRYAARLLGDGDSAREAVQHAFLQLCERTAEEFSGGREAPWLFRVCRNKALDLIRLRQRHTGDSEADLATLVGREPDPAEQAERQDLCGELARRVAQLPAGQREAIDLGAKGFPIARFPRSPARARATFACWSIARSSS